MTTLQKEQYELIHRTAHQTGLDLGTLDNTCSICHPPLETPQSFERFWRFYSNHIVPTAEDYSEITVQRFLQADRLRQRILATQRIETITAPVLRYYQRVVKAIHHRRALRFTTTQLAIQIFLINLLTDNCDERFLNNNTIQKVYNFENPLLNDRPLYGIVQTTLQAYGNLPHTTRTINEVAPELPITPQEERDRTDTPVPSADGTDTSNEEEPFVQETLEEQEALINTIYNQAQQEIDQLFGPDEEEELNNLQRFFNPLPPRPPRQLQMAGRIFKPDYFHGKPEEDAEAWLTHFVKVD